MFNFLNVCSTLLLVLSLTYAQDPVDPLAVHCEANTEPWAFVAIPEVCNEWVACRLDEFVTTGVCDDSFNFDHNSGECNWIGCHQNQPTFICAADQFPATLHAHVSDCTKHYSCQFGVVTEVPCPAGQNFDGLACAADAPCTSPCDGKGTAEPEMIPDPADCTKFLVCNAGVVAVNPACEAGQFFDNVLLECMDCYYAHCTLTDPTNTNIAREQCAGDSGSGSPGGTVAP